MTKANLTEVLKRLAMKYSITNTDEHATFNIEFDIDEQFIRFFYDKDDILSEIYQDELINIDGKITYFRFIWTIEEAECDYEHIKRSVEEIIHDFYEIAREINR